MNRHATRRGAKLLVAAVSAAAIATIAPASAAPSTPQVQSTTFAKGYTSLPNQVAVSYDVVLDGGPSAVAVTDANNNSVPGSDFVVFGSKTLVFQPNAASAFNEADAPYTATFTARALGQAPATPDSVETFTFSVDFITPFPPNVYLNDLSEGPVASDGLLVLPPGDALVINGTASDTASAANIASGVHIVNVHFYNPLANPSGVTTGGAGEIVKMRKPVEMACSPSCNRTETLAIDITEHEGFGPGYWNIRVSVTDGAGNTSSQSEVMRVLKLG